MTDSGWGRADDPGPEPTGSPGPTPGDDDTPSASWETSRGSSWENTTPYQSPFARPGSSDAGSWPSYPDQAPGYGQPAGYGQQPSYYQYGQQPPVYVGYALPNHPQATTALILGIVGLAVCPFVGIAGFVMGGRVRREIDAAPGRWSGRGLATAGWVLGIISLVYAAVVLVYLVVAVAVVSSA